MEAGPGDLDIVCGESDIGHVSERLSPETEIVLPVIEYTNHEKFNINDPIEGYDIAVYTVDITNLNTNEASKVLPACLPKKDPMFSDAIFAGWKDPFNIAVFYPENLGLEEYTIDLYRQGQSILKHVGLKIQDCKDPAWMATNTYCPPGI